MRRLMLAGALSRVDGAEQICCERLSWTMGLEFQPARQTVGQLKRGVVDCLQRCTCRVSNEMEFVEGRRFAGNEIEHGAQLFRAAPCWVQVPCSSLTRDVAVLPFHSLTQQFGHGSAICLLLREEILVQQAVE